MCERPGPIDPRDIAGINERCRSWADGVGEIVPVSIGELVIADDALGSLADVTRSLAGGGKALLVMDQTAMSRGGDDLKAMAEAVLSDVVPLTVCRLPVEPEETFHADLLTARRLAGELPEYAAVVSVGSGSVTDVAKYARHLAVEESSRPIGFVSFPTAASVTAYTSALAVLSIDGVKRTLSCRGPDAVVCDVRTLADAPRMMTLAGFGDVMARSVAGGDWFLAWQLGMDDGFSEVPIKLLASAEKAMIAAADAVAAGDLAGVRTVAEAVLLAGMAMSIVNQTAPISGWEHVISHFLDMTADHDGRAMALHGGQVGVGTLVSARAYERSWDRLDLDRIEADFSDADVASWRRKAEAVFTRYDSTGRMAAEVWRDLEKKLTRWRGAKTQRRLFVERRRAGEFDAFAGTMVRPAREVEQAMRRATAPCRFADLNEPVGPETAMAAVRFSHLIRQRFTLGDLLGMTGCLDEVFARAVLNEAR